MFLASIAQIAAAAGIVVTLFLIGAVLTLIFLHGVKKKGRVTRSLFAELFVIQMPREEVLTEGQGTKIEEKIAPMEQLFSLFSGMKDKGWWHSLKFGQPSVTWEMVYENDLIKFYVEVPTDMSDALVRSIHAVYPEAHVERAWEYDIFKPNGPAAAAHLTLQKTPLLPIRTYREMTTDPINSLAAVMAKIPRGEAAAIQLVMQPASKEWGKKVRKVAQEMQKGKDLKRALHDANKGGLISLPNPKYAKEHPNDVSPTPQDQEMIKEIEAKGTKTAFNVNIRLIASAQSEERAEALLQEMERTFVQYENTGLNGFNERKDNIKEASYNFSFRIFNEKHSLILSTDELASIYHLPLPNSHLPKVDWLTSRAAVAPTGMGDGIRLGLNTYRGEEVPVHLAPADRQRHLYIIGQTGTGKTGLLQNMTKQDIDNGEGLCIIEPHDLVDKTLEYIPEHRYKDVILFDPADLDRPLGLNMLEYDPAFPEQKTFIVDELINIFDKLYDLKTTGGPMFEQYTRNALLLLMDYPERGYTLMEVPKVLADSDFRRELLKDAKNIVVKDFWEKEAEKAGGEAALANMVPYITSKFNVFIANDFMRPIIGQSKSSLNFRQIMDEGKILLVSLSKGRLGESNMSLLGLIIVGKLMMAAFARTAQPENSRRNFYLYLDEFQNFTTSSISTILSEARKYKLNLIIAHQFLGQLPENISKAVFGNVGTLAMFRVGQEDGEFLEHYLRPQFAAHDLTNLDNFHSYVKLMKDGGVHPAFNMKTDMPPQGNAEVATYVRELSRMSYGKERNIAENEIADRYGALSPKAAMPTDMPVATGGGIVEQENFRL